MNFFTVTLFLALGVTAFGYTNQPKLEDLVEALNTREQIWMAYRSYELQISGHNQKCNNVVKTGQTYYSYDFYQRFKYGSKWGTKDLYVDINRNRANEPVLTVKNSTGGSVEYTMRFWDDKNHCFVLTFEGKDQRQCELHVWDEDIHKLDTAPLSSCIQDFEILCGGRKYEIYSRECKP